MFRVAKPLVVSKALPAAHSRKVSSAPPQPGGSGPEQQVLKLEEPIPSTSQSAPEVQEQISEASSTDSDGADEPPPEKEPPRRSLKVRLPLKLLKRGHLVLRMVSHPPKCTRNQRPMRLGWAPRPGPQRQPSRKLGLNCSKRTSPRSRRFVPGSSNSRREK